MYVLELESLADDDVRAARVAVLNVHRSVRVLERRAAIVRAVRDRVLTLPAHL
jgi:carbonic anhydrase